jgi:glucokinase
VSGDCPDKVREPNLALSLGALGGIAARRGDMIDRSRFRGRFEAKGRFRDCLKAVPTYIVQAHASPALVGAARALDDL